MSKNNQAMGDAFVGLILFLGLLFGGLYLLYFLIVESYLFIEKTIIENYFYIKIFIIINLCISFVISDIRFYKMLKGEILNYHSNKFQLIKYEFKIFITNFFYVIRLELAICISLFLIFILVFLGTMALAALSQEYQIIDNFTLETFLKFCDKIKNSLF